MAYFVLPARSTPLRYAIHPEHTIEKTRFYSVANLTQSIEMLRVSGKEDTSPLIGWEKNGTMTLLSTYEGEADTTLRPT